MTISILNTNCKTTLNFNYNYIKAHAHGDYNNYNHGSDHE